MMLKLDSLKPMKEFSSHISVNTSAYCLLVTGLFLETFMVL